jgi:hypothetical protein
VVDISIIDLDQLEFVSERLHDDITSQELLGEAASGHADPGRSPSARA